MTVCEEEDREGVEGDVKAALARDEAGDSFGGGVGEGGVGGRGPWGGIPLFSAGGGGASVSRPGPGGSVVKADVEDDACERDGARNCNDRADLMRPPRVKA